MEELETALRDLSSTESAKRLVASRVLERAARMVNNSVREKALGHPSATAAITKSLWDDDPKVVQNSVIALAEISRRYFKDDRAYPAVILLLSSPDQLTRRWAANAAVTLRGELSWPEVAPLVRDRSAKVRAVVVLLAANLAAHSELSPTVLEQLQTVSEVSNGDEDRQVREYAANLQRNVAVAVLRDKQAKPGAVADPAS